MTKLSERIRLRSIDCARYPLTTMTPPRSTSLPTSPSPFAVMGSIWVICDGHAFLGRGRVALLEEIASTGSISQAEKPMGMSYQNARRPG